MSEHTEQAALFQWALTEARHTPQLGLLYAIPNAGSGSQAGRQGYMVGEGLRKGMLDLCLPVAHYQAWPYDDRVEYLSYYIELKFGGNKPSPDQEWWIWHLRAAGHKVDVFWDWQQAAIEFESYLNIPREKRGEWIEQSGPRGDKASERRGLWMADYNARAKEQYGQA